MTNELEKQFFDTFGIEPKLVESCTKPRHKCSERFVKDCSECPRAWRKYPQITDRILLELICINEDEQPNIEWLKQCVLENLIHRFEKNIFCDNVQAVQQVRTLFEEN